MTEKRYFTVDYDEQYYIFDSNVIRKGRVEEEAEYSYDVFANSMGSDEIVDLLNEQDKIIKDKEDLIKAKNQQLEDAKQILKSEMKYACKQKQEYLNKPYVYNAYSIIEHGLIKTLEELGWD